MVTGMSYEGMEMRNALNKLNICWQQQCRFSPSCPAWEQGPACSLREMTGPCVQKVKEQNMVKKKKIVHAGFNPLVLS